ncbi:MAG TPA: peptidoglycan-binding protein, partial [Ktedonobacteraceae bacterium]|nr:peptidoglycan-binding protein [Ktedonobacteraceae bacterium]
MTQHHTNLSLNQRGKDVALLQSRLISLGYIIATSEILNEFFGQSTSLAVQQFQQREGLQMTGAVDALTARTLVNRFDADKTLLVHRPSAQPPAQTIASGNTDDGSNKPIEIVPPSSAPAFSAPVNGQQRHQGQGALRVRGDGPVLALGATSEDVAELQLALATIGLPIDTAERDAKLFGVSTAAAVRKLQALTGLEQSGVVDEQTRIVIVTALTRLGVEISDDGTPMVLVDEYTVEGHVTNGDGEPLPGATVVVFNVGLRSTQELGRVQTDQAGFYRVDYTPEEGTPPQKKHQGVDLQLALLDVQEQISFRSGLTFNAPQHAIINLASGGMQREQPSEFSSLASTLQPLLGNLGPTDLQEDTEHQDLTFLSGATNVPKAQIALWSIAAHVAHNTKLPSELFYALFRYHIPADAETIALASSTQGTDLAVNARLLQGAILATTSAALEKALSSALGHNVIPASYASRAQEDLAHLMALANTAALNSIHGMGKTSLASVMNVFSIPSDVQNKFIQLYANVSGSEQRSFWSDLAKNPDFTAEQVADLHFGIIVGRITRGHLPLIVELAAMRASGTISQARDLARLTAAEWTTLLQTPVQGQSIGIPANITAATLELAHQTYAAMLERGFVLAYPTVAFSARLASDPTSPFAAGQPVAAFLDANAAFDLTLTNIDAYARTTPISTEVRSTLLTAQRLAKLDPGYATMCALLIDGIHSAKQIYHMGRDHFVAKYGQNAAIGPTLAARIYYRSEQTYSMSLSLLTRFNQAFTSNSPAAIGSINNNALLKQASSASKKDVASSNGHQPLAS